MPISVLAELGLAVCVLGHVNVGESLSVLNAVIPEVRCHFDLFFGRVSSSRILDHPSRGIVS